MRLRTPSERRTTQKYDDTDIHDHHQDEVLQRISTPQLVNPRLQYRGLVTEFNPNLRPAAFPTIPLDQEIEDSEVRVEPGLPQPSPLTNQRHLLKNARNDERRPDSSHPFDFAPFKDPEMFAATSIDDRWSRDLGKNLRNSQLRTPSPKTLKKSNGPENRIYMQNMKILDRFRRRTEMDWNIAEMVTSEDEAEEMQHHPKELAWNCLSVTQRLSIIDAVDESCNSLETTFKLLRLTPQQRDFTLALLEKRNEYLDAEETALQMVRDRASEMLHGTDQDEIDWLTKKGGYAKLMEDNVYIGVGKIDYVTSTGKDLRLAKRYLITCGLKTELLDHWVSESTVEVGEASGVSTAEPRPAAFPTLPFDEIYHPQATVGEKTVILAHEPILEAPRRRHTPSLERQTNGNKETTIKPIETPVIESAPRGRGRPPTAKFTKPQLSTKNTHRHHSTYSHNTNSYEEKKNDEGKLQQREERDEGKEAPPLTQNLARSAQSDALGVSDNWHGHGHASAESNRSTQTVPVSNRIHPSTNPNRQGYLHQALSDSRTERYTAPAQAQPFALPPQLDQQRRSWVPDLTSESHQVAASNRLTNNPYSQINNEAPTIRPGNNGASRADGKGVSRQSMDRASTTAQSADPRSYVASREDSSRRTSMSQAAPNGNILDRSRDTPVAGRPPARMLPPRQPTDLSMIDPALRQQASRDPRPSSIHHTTEQNRQAPGAGRAPPAMMLPPKQSIDFSLIDPALRQQASRNPRPPTIHQNIEQNRQAGPLPTDNSTGNSTRKRSASNALGQSQPDGDMRASDQPKGQINGNDVGHAPSKKAKTISNRRKTIF